MDETWGSRVPARQLGRCLTDLRVRSGVNVDAIAATLGCSRTKIWRMERGVSPARPPDVSKLCDLYQAATETRELLLDLARASRDGGWWHTYADAIPDWFALYLSMESAAARIRQYDTCLVNGLLQTRRYLTELFRLTRPELPEPERDRFIAVRMERQRLLVRRLPPAPEIEMVIHEAVLRGGLPDAVVWRDQLGHLRDLSFLPDLSLRVLPFTAGPVTSASCGGVDSFTLLDFPPADGRFRAEPSTVYFENPTGAFYQDRPAEFAAYEAVWHRLERKALDPQQSRSFIESMLREQGR